MQAGKLPLDLLAELLGKIDIDDPRVRLGPRPGEDAALIDLGDRYLVAKTDPVTFANDLIGWYLVQVNANDLAVMGATPHWLMATLLLTEQTTAEQVHQIFDQMLEACGALGVTLVGGHTEITYGLPRPMAIGAMLGEVARDKVTLTSGAKPGDSIVLIGAIAIEGTAILAREASEQLCQAGVDAGMIEAAREFLFAPGISVVKAAAAARDAVKVHAMHDPTEGGLATGLLEVARAAGVGMVVDAQRIPVLPQCEVFCRALGLDPLGLIASGALLATVAEQDTAPLLVALERDGIPACRIGRITRRQEGLRWRTKGSLRDLPVFDRDELARFFANGGPTLQSKLRPDTSDTK